MSRTATRRRVIARGLAAGGALAATAHLGLATRATAQAGDARLLKRAVRLEQEAAVVYETLAEGDVLDDEVAAAAEAFAGQQREHVLALTAALEDAGQEAPPPPRPDAIDGLEEAESQAEGLALAVDLENALIRAYGRISESPAGEAVLRTTVQIACNAAQHLVVLRQQLGEPPLPEAFETGAPQTG